MGPGFSLQYITVDQILSMVSKFDRGGLMAKFDVEATYHNIALHPSDWYLLGLSVGKYFH